MEKKLKNLLDYQRFEHSERLDRLISETESRAAQQLSDEELDTVYAAGEVDEKKALLKKAAEDKIRSASGQVPEL